MLVISYKSEKKVNNRGRIGYLLAVNRLVKPVTVLAKIFTNVDNFLRRSVYYVVSIKVVEVLPALTGNINQSHTSTPHGFLCKMSLQKWLLKDQDRFSKYFLNSRFVGYLGC